MGADICYILQLLPTPVFSNIAPLGETSWFNIHLHTSGKKRNHRKDLIYHKKQLLSSGREMEILLLSDNKGKKPSSK